MTSPELGPDPKGYVKHPITERVVNSKVADKVVKPAAHAVVAHTPEPVKHAAKATAHVTKVALTKPVYTEEDLENQRIDATPEDGDGSIHLDINNVMAIIGIWAGVVCVVGFLLLTGGGAH